MSVPINRYLSDGDDDPFADLVESLAHPGARAGQSGDSRHSRDFDTLDPAIDGDLAAGGEDVVLKDGVLKVKRGRGRPKGSRNKSGSAKPGPKPSSSRSRSALSQSNGLAFVAGPSGSTSTPQHSAGADSSSKVSPPVYGDDETFLSLTVQVSASEALHGPESIKWME